MTISKQTARDVAERIYTRFEALGVTEAADPLKLGLGIIEDIQLVSGNKSFTESMNLLHREFKEVHRSKKKERNMLDDLEAIAGSSKNPRPQVKY